MTLFNANIGNWGFSIHRKWALIRLTRFSPDYPQKWELQIGPFCLERYRT
jgi:hypothetical protein